MKRLIPPLLLMLFSIAGMAQNSFKEGYFITNDGKKTECWIKNLDWKNNPRSVSYKLTDEGTVEILSDDQITEFGVNDFSKFVRLEVDVDTSSRDLDELSENSAPEFRKETALLKVLIEGPISLYYYSDEDGIRYFYKSDTGRIQQLIYKRFLISGKVAESYFFRSQLRNTLKCESSRTDQFQQLKYSKSSLILIFERYYACKQIDYTKYDAARKTPVLLFTLKAGLNVSSLSVQSENNPLRDTDFPNNLTFSPGLEAEYVFPYRENHWSIFLEPSYQHYTSNEQTPIGPATVDYASIDVAMGIRYSLFPGNQSKLYFNVMSSIPISLDEHSTIVFDDKFVLRGTNKLLAGIGYRHDGKFNAEIRYHSNQNILADYPSFGSQYSVFSFLVGYTVF